jgi:putative hydrolase of the HAD superfamily
MKKAVLFDLGNTLVRYYGRPQWPGVIADAMAEVRACLTALDLLWVSEEAMWQAVRDEDHEAADHRVRPLEGRLWRIFRLQHLAPDADVDLALSRAFLTPIFGLAHRYADTLPALEALRAEGYALAIVSNTPWGSPGRLWREELERLDLRHRVDASVFCRDVGWRKPARPIFVHALDRLGLRPEACVFVGDHPTWDVAGPRRAGIDALLIDRGGALDPAAGALGSLAEVAERLRRLDGRRASRPGEGRAE